MKTIGVIVAMNKEMAKLKTIINVTETFEIYNNTFFCGEYNNTKIVLAISGIGKVNAAMTTMLMIANFNPSLIINSGIAGGYATDLEPLDIIVGNKVGYSDVDMTSPIAGAFPYGQIEGMPRFFESQMKYINEKMQEEAVQEEENADESILKSISEELIKTLQQNKTNEKFWYLLLAALMAVSVGLQTAVMFVLAFRER